MPDFKTQVREALRDKCGCELPAGIQYDADGISSPGFYRPAIRDCPKCLSAAVARVLTKVIESVPYQWRARLRREVLAALREAP